MESSKEQHLHETDMFSNFKNGFTVTFDQFNASLLYYCNFLKIALTANF